MRRPLAVAALAAALLTSCAASAPGLRAYAPPFDNASSCPTQALEPNRGTVILWASWLGPLPSLAVAWTDTTRGIQGDTLRTQPRAGVAKGIYRVRAWLSDLSGNASCADSISVTVTGRPARVTDLRVVP